MSIVNLCGGGTFDLAAPDPGQISLQYIAAALARIRRSGGASPVFYSVAQHSVAVSVLCSPEAALAGLTHDAAEAYCGDCLGPVKKMLRGAWDLIEIPVQLACWDALGVEVDESILRDVAAADAAAWELEREYWELVSRGESYTAFTELRQKCERVPGLVDAIRPVGEQLARRMFLYRWNELRVGQRDRKLNRLAFEILTAGATPPAPHCQGGE